MVAVACGRQITGSFPPLFGSGMIAVRGWRGKRQGTPVGEGGKKIFQNKGKGRSFAGTLSVGLR